MSSSPATLVCAADGCTKGNYKGTPPGKCRDCDTLLHGWIGGCGFRPPDCLWDDGKQSVCKYCHSAITCRMTEQQPLTEQMSLVAAAPAPSPDLFTITSPSDSPSTLPSNPPSSPSVSTFASPLRSGPFKPSPSFLTHIGSSSTGIFCSGCHLPGSSFSINLHPCTFCTELFHVEDFPSSTSNLCSKIWTIAGRPGYLFCERCNVNGDVPPGAQSYNNTDLPCCHICSRPLAGPGAQVCDQCQRSFHYGETEIGGVNYEWKCGDQVLDKTEVYECNRCFTDPAEDDGPLDTGPIDQPKCFKCKTQTLDLAEGIFTPEGMDVAICFRCNIDREMVLHLRRRDRVDSAMELLKADPSLQTCTQCRAPAPACSQLANCVCCSLPVHSSCECYPNMDPNNCGSLCRNSILKHCSETISNSEGSSTFCSFCAVLCNKSQDGSPCKKKINTGSNNTSSSAAQNVTEDIASCGTCSEIITEGQEYVNCWLCEKPIHSRKKHKNKQCYLLTDKADCNSKACRNCFNHPPEKQDVTDGSKTN